MLVIRHWLLIYMSLMKITAGNTSYLNAMSKLSSALSIKMLTLLVVKGSNVQFLPRISSCPLCISLVSNRSKRTSHSETNLLRSPLRFDFEVCCKHTPTIATAAVQKSYQLAWAEGPSRDTLMAQFDPTVIVSSIFLDMGLALKDRNLLSLIANGSC